MVENTANKVLNLSEFTFGDYTSEDDIENDPAENEDDEVDASNNTNSSQKFATIRGVFEMKSASTSNLSELTEAKYNERKRNHSSPKEKESKKSKSMIPAMVKDASSNIQ